jgi:hypothetical protein
MEIQKMKLKDLAKAIRNTSKDEIAADAESKREAYRADCALRRNGRTFEKLVSGKWEDDHVFPSVSKAKAHGRKIRDSGIQRHYVVGKPLKAA